MVMRKLGICLRPATNIHITMVNSTFCTQGSLKKLFQGLYVETIFKIVTKDVTYIQIKIILIILIKACNHTLIQGCHHTLIQTYHHSVMQIHSYL